jgi:hypothetical protein
MCTETHYNWFFCEKGGCTAFVKFDSQRTPCKEGEQNGWGNCTEGVKTVTKPEAPEYAKEEARLGCQMCKYTKEVNEMQERERVRGEAAERRHEDMERRRKEERRTEEDKRRREEEKRKKNNKTGMNPSCCWI